MDETVPKKMVSRNVAIALGIICIILVAGMVEIWLYYLVQDIEKDETITKLNNQIFQLNSQISQLNSSITNLQNQVNNLTDVLNLNRSTVWVSGETVNLMNLSPTYEENASFAGYVSVQVSSQYNATVEVEYFSHGVSYENSVIVGNSGTAVFPVLPSSSISIYIFQTLSEYFILSGPLDATATITYYY